MNRFSKSYGAIMVEAVVVVSLLIMVAVFIFDLIRFAHAYHSVGQAVRSCMIVPVFHSGTPSPLTVNQGPGDYESFSYPTFNQFVDCANTPSSSADCIHRAVHWKIRQHLEADQPPIEQVQLSSNWQADSEGGDSFSELVVTVSAVYSGLNFFGTKDIQIVSIADPCGIVP